MANAPEDQDSKSYDPTPQRLRKAREEGDVIRSEDLQAALAWIGLLLALIIAGHWALRIAAGAAAAVIGEAEQLRLGADGGRILTLVTWAAWPVLVLLILPGALVLIWLIGSGGLVFAPSKLEFRSSRLSVLSNFKQKFGRSGMVDFLKKAAKMLLISAGLTLYLQHRSAEVFLSLRLSPGQILLLLADMLIGFLLLVIALNTAAGAADLLWQRLEFLRRNRMSRKELGDEMKDSEGDPHLKASRMRRAREIASRRMMADVPGADVVIVNPTHYAVALKWDRVKGRAPVCVAKGQDEIALRIRELAREAGVPIRHDPPTARLLFATIRIGAEVQPEHYAAVAAAIRFAQSLRTKRRHRPGGSHVG